MSTASVADRAYELLAPLAQERGLELVATEVAGTKGTPVVRVYLDREGGIDLDAIAEANAWISAALEEADPVSGAWVLEVSSPGIERPLRKMEDFARYVGERVAVSTAAPLDGRRRFTGVLEAVEGEQIVIDCDGTSFRVPLDAIAKANLKPDITFGED